LFPYISGGLSNIWFSPKTENGSRALFNSLNKYKRNALVYDLDLGIKYQIINNLSVKLEGGFHFPNTDNLDDIATGKDKDFYATGIIGISYSFFGKKDTDGDGILDDVDKCPDQPEDFDGFQDDDGCPDFDNDSDGVPDSVDNCPNVPGSVANKGCPDESQNDSTYTTAPKEIVIEGEATFAPGTANILPEAHTELNRIVKLLELYPDINWRIEGYTDKVSTENLLVRPLSQRRAEAILNYFVSKGLPSFQFRVYDMGNKFPIANNNTEYGRKKNRRVVLVREN
jgi:outer membrane protein OmpA-like peptidoglycan-associated protein